MIYEKSAGGIVFCNDEILLLKKYNGDWVLPKGRIQEDEDIQEAAKREVKEETGVDANILKYVGEIHYTYEDSIKKELVHKTVFWFIMTACDFTLIPQKEEGFIEAKYHQIDKAINILKYDDEREIVRAANNLSN